MKIIGYIEAVYNEMLNKVTWPTWTELQSSAIVVMIAALIIALIIFVMDFTFEHLMDLVYSMFY